MNNKNSPECPKCKGSMSLTKAKRSKFKGTYFWGCDNFPKCRGIVNQSKDDEFDKENNRNNLEKNNSYSKKINNNRKIPIPWREHKSRKSWLSEYTTVGSLPSFASNFFLENNDLIKNILSQTLFLYNKGKNRRSNHNADFLSSLLIKFLQRGFAPLCTIGIEKSVIKLFVLDKVLQKNNYDESDISLILNNNISDLKFRNSIINSLIFKNLFKIDDEFNLNNDSETSLFDSEHEENFINSWIPNNLGKTASHWFIPQVNLDNILEAYGLEGFGDRRIDYLLCHPNLKPLAIEIDGDQHSDNPEIDKQRNAALKSCDIDTYRIPSSELKVGKGQNLDKIIEYCEDAFTKDYNLNESEKSLGKAVKEITILTKIQYALIKSIKFGWINNDEDWVINITGVGYSSISAITDIIQIIKSFNIIYDFKFFPKNLVINNDSGSYLYDLNNNKELKIKKSNIQKTSSHLSICVESDASVYQKIEDKDNNDSFDIIIRNIFLPISISTENFYTSERRVVDNEKVDLKIKSLDIFLQNIFRKKTFRPLQAASIINSLRHIESVVLLPTGAGKSFIYQLSGLLMPGVTLVVDPIISLIEDQVEGLLNYGIDRAAPIVSGDEDLESYLKGIERGEYLFIFHSPERLQSPVFRTKLKGLSQSSIINLAVIDESHCVSEWGHDFRPAYLNLSRNIKEFGKDQYKTSPPIIALTGTASRAVLRDILADLEIDKSKSESVIRPESFDRKELKFFISRSDQVQYAETTFKGTLNSLPDKFNVPKNDFFNASGKDTYCGIIFVPFAGGFGDFSYGVMGTKDAFENATRTKATYYSGKNPNRNSLINWDIQKRSNVREFKTNKIPALIATKAFGMGIDKPNIRYTIHLGVPGSIESFYQEAGRAGRDRQDSYCGIIFSEYDEERTNSLLDPAISLEELKKRFDLAGKKTNERDDITRQLFFHTSSFSGQKEEIDEVNKTLKSIDNLDKAQTIEINFSNSKNRNQEKSIYRLTKIGIFRDYEVNFGSQTFKIFINKFDIAKCKENLLNYISSSQPGRVRSFSNELDLIKSSDTKSNALLLAKSLINFTYDVIERSRRRAIFESVLLARNSHNDRSIRKRLLDYLQEGVSNEQLTELLELSNIEFKHWFKILEKIDTAVDAGEFRGMAIRGLESYPDHPGLLLMRSVTEIFCSDSDESISLQALYSSIQSSQNKYDIPQTEWFQTMDWLINLANTKNANINQIIYLAFYEAIRQNIIGQELKEYFENYVNKSENKNVLAIQEVFDTIDISNKAEASIGMIKQTLSDPKISELLERR